jgi:hypothetical protein
LRCALQRLNQLFAELASLVPQSFATVRTITKATVLQIAIGASALQGG